MDQLSNALIRIQAARAQASGSSLIPGARSSIDPKVSIRGAIAHIRAARQAVGLQVLASQKYSDSFDWADYMADFAQPRRRVFIPKQPPAATAPKVLVREI
jgi:hypothetical protein